MGGERVIRVDVTPRAARRVRALLTGEDLSGRYGLRIGLADPADSAGRTGLVEAAPEYRLSLAPAPSDDELVLPRYGFDVFVAKVHSDRLDGVRVDYVESDAVAGFLVDRPVRVSRAVSPQPGPGGGRVFGAPVDVVPPPGTSPELEDRVAAALEGVRPVLAGDGGDVELVGVGDGAAYIRLRGACSGCGAALTTLTQLIETAVAALVPEVPRTVLVG
jgi:iron-sulfur cluster assembly protein